MLLARSSHRRHTIQAHILKSWNFLILHIDGFLATYRPVRGRRTTERFIDNVVLADSMLGASANND